MSREIVVRVRCNVCGSITDEEKVTVAEIIIDRKHIVADLCAACSGPVRAVWEVGDRPGSDPVPAAARPKKKSTSAPSSQYQQKEKRTQDLRLVRQWAMERGMISNTMGRVPDQVIESYNAEHGMNIATVAETLGGKKAS